MCEINNLAPQIVIVTVGSAGDLFPFLRVGVELAARGLRIAFLAPGVFAEQVAAAGLPFHPLPVDEQVLRDPHLWHPRKGFNVVWQATRPAMQEFVRFVDALPEDEPAAIIAHPLALADADLCRAARPRMHIIAAYLAPSNLRTMHGAMHMGPLPIPAWTPAWLRRWLWNTADRSVLAPAALPGINAARSRRALAPVASFMDHMESIADQSLLLFPSWFAPTQPDWPQPCVEGDFALYDPLGMPALGDELQAFLAAGDAPIVFTHGTGNRQAQTYFRHAIAATGKLGRRAILLTPERDQLPAALPPNILWQDYVPLRALLPHVAALSHHGGIGTTAEALRAGIPQLIVPMAFDQFDNAARVQTLGAGLGLPAARTTVFTLTSRLKTLLASPTIQAACKAAQAHFEGESRLVRAIDEIQISISKT
ncbi:MAG: glycosyltransferase [Gammaproteobacteria bacterium]